MEEVPLKSTYIKSSLQDINSPSEINLQETIKKNNTPTSQQQYKTAFSVPRLSSPAVKVYKSEDSKQLKSKSKLQSQKQKKTKRPVSKLKMERGPKIKIVIDEEKILQALRERELATEEMGHIGGKRSLVKKPESSNKSTIENYNSSKTSSKYSNISRSSSLSSYSSSSSSNKYKPLDGSPNHHKTISTDFNSRRTEPVPKRRKQH